MAILPTVIVVALLLLAPILQAQEVEPRRWTHTPVGANFLGLGYSFTDGNIFLDPSLQIDGAQAEIHGVGLGYVRSFGLFGKSARIDLKVPYASGEWSGLIDGDFAMATRTGFADPSLRFAINLVGAPALKPAEFAKYRSNTIIGIGVEVVAPLGEYSANKLVNLGSNRWVIRPQIGVVHQTGKLTSELTASFWLYGDNDEYRVDSMLEQDPFYTIQGHLIYTFRPGLWVSLSGGYGEGAESTIDIVEQDDEQGSFIWAASFGFALDRYHGLKFAFLNGRAVKDTGADFNRIQIGYSYMWGSGL